MGNAGRYIPEGVMKRHRSAVYRERFERLWAALAVCDAHAAGEISPELVAGIIGSSESYARMLLFKRVRFIFRGNRGVSICRSRSQ